MRARILEELRELRRDRRAVLVLVALPVLALVVFGCAAGFFPGAVRAAVVGPLAATTGPALPEFFEVVVTAPEDTRAEAERRVRDDEVDVAFVASGSAITTVALVDGSDLFAAQSSIAVLNKISGAVRPEVLFNPELKTSWVLVPAIIGLIVTFVGLIVTGIGLRRQTGAPEESAAGGRSGVVLGEIAPYFLLTALELIAVTVFGLLLFGVPFTGSVLVFAVGAAIFVFLVVCLGALITSVARTTGRVVQVTLVFLLVQIVLSGMIFPLDAMAAGVRWIGYLLPLTYFTMIAQGVMLRGAPLTSLWLPLLVLMVMAAVVVRFRRDPRAATDR
ncbi:ABC transporter permease [Nocardia sp. AG03]|uniref:ABC transporter permease n=1 Tax=Nocardia sp. AG03 TaxID=3025312 RepID=UPI002418BA22|nr:ABC transporter permease [Nocardia sp. AG03]